MARTTPDLSRAEALSVTVLDRNERLLRAFTTDDGLWRLPATTETVDPRYIAMLVAYEDGRFYRHLGVDPLATLRAAGQLLRHGRIVSGASTLTMQVARLIEGPEPRSFATKFDQAITALALERRLSKRQILELYLRLAPFGGNLEGVRAASLAYFGKEPLRLSVAERALLVAIPQSPAARRPDRSQNAARRARDRVLARALAAGVITPEEANEARRAPIPRQRRAFPQLAPHLAEAEVAAHPKRLVHRLTIDRDRQLQLEHLARAHAARLGPHLSAALIAIDHATGEVLSLVGSAGYLDTARLGAIDMTDAVRSPGSTLKPFVYGLAFERGIAHPETHIEDRPARFGRYAPTNFDKDFHGTVTIREALAMSLNIPAVKILSEVGPLRLAARLNRAGGRLRLPDDAEPSLAIALGGAGLTLRDLATLYTALGRGGEAIPLSYTRPQSGTDHLPPRPVARLMSSVAAWYVGNILKGAPPPANAKGYRIAFKTGTSYGYRDAWAAGFDGRHVIVAWVGRPDGTSTPASPAIARQHLCCSMPSPSSPSARLPSAQLPAYSASPTSSSPCPCSVSTAEAQTRRVTSGGDRFSAG
ncbi:MAG: penicillin-binding protein 1C [Hyphomicrobiaceae bacterium]